VATAVVEYDLTWAELCVLLADISAEFATIAQTGPTCTTKPGVDLGGHDAMTTTKLFTPGRLARLFDIVAEHIPYSPCVGELRAVAQWVRERPEDFHKAVAALNREEADRP
jgi:hypothetical protein